MKINNLLLLYVVSSNIQLNKWAGLPPDNELCKSYEDLKMLSTSIIQPKQLKYFLLSNNLFHF